MLEPDVSVSHIRLAQNLFIVDVREVEARFRSSFNREDVLCLEVILLLLNARLHDFLDSRGLGCLGLLLFFSSRLLTTLDFFLSLAISSCWSLALLFLCIFSCGLVCLLFVPQSHLLLVVRQLLLV